MAMIVAQDLVQEMRIDSFALRRISSSGFWRSVYGSVPILVVPLATFLASVATFAPRTRIGFARTFGMLCLFSLPTSVVLGDLGMAHPRDKSNAHPTLYLSEYCMFIIPLVTFAAIMTYRRFQIKVQKRQA